MLLIGLTVLVVIAIGDVYINGLGVFEQFGRGFTLTLQSQIPQMTVTLESSQAAAEIERLLMQGQGGSISVSGAETDTIDVRATVRVFAKNEEDARAYTETGLAIEPLVEGGTLKPRLVEGRRTGIDRIDVQWTVIVPKHLMVEVTNSLGAVKVSDVNAPVTVAASGSVDVTNVGAPLRVTSQGGILKVRGVEGDVSIESAFGSVEITDVMGNLDLKTATSDTKISNIQGRVVTEGSMAAMEIARVGGGLQSHHKLGFVAVREIVGEIVLDVTAGSAIIEPLTAAPITATVAGGDLTLAIPRHLVAKYSFSLEANPGEILQNPDLAQLMIEHQGQNDQHPVKVEVKNGTLNMRLAQ